MALTQDQRRLVVGICVVVAAFTMVSAAYNYILEPMLDGLGASEGQTSLLRQLPSMATLAVVFLGGVLGDRFGDRRMLWISAVFFTLGSLLVAIAPVFGIAALGLVVQSIAMSAGSVISLGFLSARISDPAGRASAFSVFAIVGPFIYLVVPILTGALVDNRTWRLVPALWAIGGLAMFAAVRRLLPQDGPPRARGELITPLLAGLVLTAAVQAINAAADEPLLSFEVLLRAGLVVAGIVALVVLFRRAETPSLSLAALRTGGMLVLLAVVLLVPFANLWFYATMGYQYVFGLTTLQTALAMAPAQVGAIVGAVITRKLLTRLGIRRAGTITLLAFAATLLPMWLINAGSPLWVPILVVSLYAAAFTGASIPLTNAIMNTAPAGEEGSASAFRSASGHLGAALGVVFTSAVITTVVTTSLTGLLDSQGLANDQARGIVDEIMDGASSENISSQYSIPVSDVDTMSTDVGLAMIDGWHSVAGTGAVVALACAGIFTVALRRQEHAPGVR